MKKNISILIMLLSLLTSCNNVVKTNSQSSLKESESISEESSVIENQQKEYVSLVELEPIIKEIGYCNPTFNKCCLGTDKFLLNGFLINEGISMHPGIDTPSSLTFDISDYNYDTFVATIGKNDQEFNCHVEFQVLVDNKVKYKSDKIAHNYMEFIEIDIKDAHLLTLVVNNGGDSHTFDASTWAYPTLINKQDLKPVSLRPEGLPYVVSKGVDINSYNAAAIVTYNTGVFKKISSEELKINNFNNQIEGEQLIEVSYLEAKSNYKIVCSDKNNYLSLLDMKKHWIDYATIGTVPTVGIDIDDKTPFSIAGINYKEGIGLHPLSDDKAAYITIDTSSYNFKRFHAVVGKTRTALRNEVMVYIYSDNNNLLYSSGFLTPGKEEIIDISIEGVKLLKVVVDSGDDSIDFDCAGIADSYFYK